nr:putative ribonuclease H-like domain-containing protein [Tanacetum cinerariifolium]
MHKPFPLPVMEFPLSEEVSTASEESSHYQKKRDAIAEKIALLLKSSSNCSASDETGKKKGRTVTLTADDMQKRKNDTFDGNEATKKTKKNLLKQQYGNFKAEGSETLEQTLTDCRSDLDTMSLDDLYNHLKVYESEVQKKSESNLQNMAFIFSAKHSSGNKEVNTASVSAASTNVSTASTNIGAASISQDTACAYIASQSSGSQIKFKDVNQFNEDDMEEMDIKWNMALLSMRADRYWKKTGKKITIQGIDEAEFDMSKVGYFNCHKMGPFARECKAPRSQDRRRRDNYRQGSKVEEHTPKALMAIAGVGWDWSYMANDEENHALVADEEAPTEFTLMAKTSAESEELELVKKEKEGLDSKLAGFQTASKDVDSLLESQRLEKNKEGLGYIAVPPPPAQIYSPPKKDLSWTGLPEFANDTVTDYSMPSLAIESTLDDAQNRNPSVTKTEASPSTISPKPFIKFMKATDSGCSRHMTGNISYLSEYEPFDGEYVSFSQGGCKITSKGTIKTGKLEFENAYFVKELKYNLFSVSQICDNKNSVLFTYSECIMLGRNFKLSYDANVLLRTPRQHNMYSINLNNIVLHKDLTCLVAKTSADEGMKWHTRLEAAKTLLVDAKLPVTFWAKAINTACYVQNRVSVNKSQNKTPYELFNGRTPAIGFLKQFGCHVMILNTLDNLGKFEAKGDEGYFIGYSMSSKAFRVFNKRTKRVEENLHVDFLENKAIEKGAGPNWLFDIDSLTKSINYMPVVVAGTNSTNFSGTKDAARQEPQETCNYDEPESNGNSNPTATSTYHPADQLETLIVETLIPTTSLPVPTTCLNNSLEPLSDTRLISKRVANQVETPSLDNILTLTNQFEDILRVTTNSDELNGVEANVRNMETTITTSPTPTLRIHKHHPKSQIIGLVDTLIQTRHKSKEVGEQSFIAIIHQKTDPALLQFCLFSCFLSQVEPKKIFDALQDPCWVEAMQEELLQFKIQNVWSLVDCPKGAIRLLLAYASLMGFTVYQMDVKSAFLYGTIDEEVQRGNFILVQVYVDDIIFGSSNPQLCREFEARMHENFQMSAMGELSFFLGLQVLQKEDGIFLSHDKSDSEQRTHEFIHVYLASASVYVWIGQHTRRTRIAQSSVLPPVADEPASPLGDGSQGEACPTYSGFVADQDRENIAKTLTLPSDSAPRVTSLTADEGSTQQKLDELTALCTSLQRQQSEMVAKFKAHELEITSLKVRIKVLEDKDRWVTEQSGEDAPIKGRKQLKKEWFYSHCWSPCYWSFTGNDVVPTAGLIFATATVRMNKQIARDAKIARIHAEEELQMMINSLHKSNETVVKYLQEYDQILEDLSIRERIELISDLVKYQENYAQVLKYQTLQRKPRTKKQKKDYYMAVIKGHSGWKTKDFKGMSFKQIESKFNTVWKQIEDFIPIGSKEEAERLKRKGLRLEQESAKKLKRTEEVSKEVKSSEEVPEEKVKKMMQLVPIKEVYVEALQVKHLIIDWKVYTEGQRSYWKITRLGGSSASYQFFVDMLKHLDREDLNQLWRLVKESLSIRLAASNKEMKLWVKLKRLEGLPLKKGLAIGMISFMEFSLSEEVSTASEESSHCQKKRDATVEKIALLLKSSSNCQSKSYDSYAKLCPMSSPVL